MLGGGHAHLHVLQALAREPLAGAQAVLITPHGHLSYSGMVPGVVAGSVRVSLEPPTIALAFDAARAKAAALESALQGSLASRGATASSLPTATAAAAP